MSTAATAALASTIGAEPEFAPVHELDEATVLQFAELHTTSF